MTQRTVTRAYLPFIDPDFNNPPEDVVERLAIGEIYFLTFAPVMMMLYHEELSSRDDWVGSHAMKRVMQVQFNARDEVELVRGQLADYAARFPLTRLDRDGSHQQIYNLVQHDFSAGKPDEAMNLLLSYVKSAPTDAPYSAYWLFVDFEKMIKDSNHLDKAEALVNKKLRALQETAKTLKTATTEADDDPILTGDYPVWYWLYQGRRGPESFRQMRLRQLNSQIAALETWLGG